MEGRNGREGRGDEEGRGQRRKEVKREIWKEE